MRLDELLRAVPVTQIVGDPTAVEVASVVHDSRAVTNGSLFCCIPGALADGHDFAAVAVDAGAVALLCERTLPLAVAQAVVAQTRAAIGPVAAAFHGDPSRSLDGRRHHRHQRQDDDRSSAALDPRARGPRRRDHRHPHGRTHDARSVRPASATRAAARRRHHRRRDGGVVARARTASRRRHLVSRRRVHEPEP